MVDSEEVPDGPSGLFLGQLATAVLFRFEVLVE